MKTKEKEDANKKRSASPQIIPRVGDFKILWGRMEKTPYKLAPPTLVPSPLLPPPIENRLRRPFKALKS